MSYEPPHHWSCSQQQQPALSASQIADGAADDERYNDDIGDVTANSAQRDAGFVNFCEVSFIVVILVNHAIQWLSDLSYTSSSAHSVGYVQSLYTVATLLSQTVVFANLTRA